MTREKAKEKYNPNLHVCMTKYKRGKDRIWTVEHNPKFDSEILQYDLLDKSSLRRVEIEHVYIKREYCD